MATNFTENPNYDSVVYQIQLTDPVQGGAGGVTNAPLQALVNRTAYLKGVTDALVQAISGAAGLNSPTFTGTPKVPTPQLGDNSALIPSTQWVNSTMGGVLNLSVAGNQNVTLTTVQAGNGTFEFTGALTGNIKVIVPAGTNSKWAVSNRTTGAYTLTVCTPTGTGVTITQGKNASVFCDGTDVYPASNDYVQPSTPVSGLETAASFTYVNGVISSYTETIGGIVYSYALTYTAGLITTVVITNNANSRSRTENYTYTNGLLTGISATES